MLETWDGMPGWGKVLTAIGAFFVLVNIIPLLFGLISLVVNLPILAFDGLVNMLASRKSKTA